MIVELVAIGSVSVVASLAYTARIVRLALEAEKAWIPPAPPPPPLSRLEEKRRILERGGRMDGSPPRLEDNWGSHRGHPGVRNVDAALLALADETDGNVDP